MGSKILKVMGTRGNEKIFARLHNILHLFRKIIKRQEQYGSWELELGVKAMGGRRFRPPCHPCPLFLYIQPSESFKHNLQKHTGISLP